MVTDLDPSPIDAELIQRRMKDLGIPGFSLAVVEEGEIATVHASGVRRRASADPVQPETLFQAASMSKPVAAFAALRLVANGLLQLDGDVNEALRSWQIPAVDGWQPRVTLRNLLSHSAGLTVHGFPGYNGSAARPTPVQVLDGPANTPPVRVDIMPGVLPRYSGGGFTVLQLLLEDVTGRPFPELMRELVLDPLRMTTATYEQPLPVDRHGEAASGHVGGGVVEGEWHVYPEMAAAGLWCTPSDLARFVIAIQRCVRGEASGSLPRHLAEQMVRTQVPGWGLGLRLEGEDPNRRFSHGAGNEGFLGFLMGTVAGSEGIVVMANAESANPLLNETVVSVASGWAGFQAAPPLDVAATLARLAGEYRSADGLVIRVAAVPAELTLKVGEQNPAPLDFITVGEWTVRGLRADVSFDISGDGPVPVVSLRQWGTVTRAERVTSD